MKSIQKVSVLASALFAASSLLVLSGTTGCAGSATKASTGEFIDDGVITTRVKTALLKDDTTPGTAIKVETFKGVVQLSGFVDTAFQKERAATIAAAVPGVQGIVNNISLK
jgi:osmotically-inducible protein OsmY